jgi:hypothetical protein
VSPPEMLFLCTQTMTMHSGVHRGTRQLAFVNVAFGSGQFWVLVCVDFVMLMMRDVRASDSTPPHAAQSCDVATVHVCRSARRTARTI